MRRTEEVHYCDCCGKMAGTDDRYLWFPKGHELCNHHELCEFCVDACRYHKPAPICLACLLDERRAEVSMQGARL